MDSFYLIHAAFTSSFWTMTAFCVPFVLVGLIAIVTTLSFLVCPHPYSLIFLVVLGLPAYISAYIIYTYSTSNSIDYNHEFRKTIATHIYNKKIKKYKSDDEKPFHILKYETDNPVEYSMSNFRNKLLSYKDRGYNHTDYFQNFKTKILSQVPENKIIKEKDIINLLNPLFFQCMNSVEVNLNDKKIKEMEDRITNYGITCSKKAAEQIISQQLILK